jgi:type IX secretion system PorP/SprF family membrane protein
MKFEQVKKGLLAILALCFYSEYIYSQDIHFSQINNTPLILNPSLAGYVNGDTRTILNYKEQWKSITVPYKTFAVSFDMPFFRKKWKNDYIGMGVSLFNDKAGDAKMGITQFDYSLAYSHTNKEKSKFLVGLQGGWAQRSFDITQLTWDNQYNGSSFDPNLPSNEPASINNNFSYFDFAAGTAWDYTASKLFRSIAM